MRSRFNLLIIGIVFIPLMVACVGGAVNLNEGINSFRVQDYRSAFIRLMPEAEKGQPDAQYAVGYMYYYGQGVVEDRKKAWFWIDRAAGVGQPDAVEAVKILSRPQRLLPLS
ncbi:MAG: tetratricopeptide repeat protein [Legionellales bacterium]